MQRSTWRFLTVLAMAGMAATAFAGDDKPAAVKADAKAKPNPLMGAPDSATVGAIAPDFTLTDTDGKELRLSDYVAEGKIVVLEWFNPDCPFVKKHHMVNKSMAATYTKANEEGVVWLAINSGAAGKQGYGLERNQKAIEEYGIAYPVLLDESGMVGKMYGAKTTPHMFVVSEKGVLIYAGAIDNKPDAETLGDVNYVTACLSSHLKGEPVANATTKPYGCSVKYAPAS